MGENKWLGDKTGQGFYKKVKDDNGKSEILALDLQHPGVQPSPKVKFATLEATKPIEKLADRFKVLVGGKDKAGDFYRKTFAGLFAYVSNRIPEITDSLYKIDDALRAGFGWDHGPVRNLGRPGRAEGPGAGQGRRQNRSAVGRGNGGRRPHRLLQSERSGREAVLRHRVEELPGHSGRARTSSSSITCAPRAKCSGKTPGASVLDMGDGILNVEFHSKMNALGSDVIQGLLKGVELAEKDFRGLVVGNDAPNFSAGANLGLVYMYALDQEYDELNLMIAQFQQAMMRMRYSSIPVVGAPHGLALGGGCELNLHADQVVAAAETYMGLVEFGVGLIPAGGGTKEMTLRTALKYEEGEPEYNLLRNTFMTVSTAKVSTSAAEAFDLGFLRRGDEIVVNSNRVLAQAKAAAIELAEDGYTLPVQKTNIKVHGKGALGMFLTGVHAMKEGRYISDHDSEDCQQAGLHHVRRRPEQPHRSIGAVPAGPGARSLPQPHRRAENAGADSEHPDDRQTAAELELETSPSWKGARGG